MSRTFTGLLNITGKENKGKLAVISEMAERYQQQDKSYFLGKTAFMQNTISLHSSV